MIESPKPSFEISRLKRRKKFDIVGPASFLSISDVDKEGPGFYEHFYYIDGQSSLVMDLMLALVIWKAQIGTITNSSSSSTNKKTEKKEPLKTVAP